LSRQYRRKLISYTQLYWLTYTITRQKSLIHSSQLSLQFLTKPIAFKKAESSNAYSDSQEPNAVILKAVSQYTCGSIF
jgi:hypothetical protein